MDNNGKRVRAIFTVRTVANIVTGCVVALVYVMLINFDDVRVFFEGLLNIIAPITTGFILAFLINLMMSWLEKVPFKGIKIKGLRRALSLTLTIIVYLLLIAGIIFAIVPQTVASVTTLAGEAQKFLVNSKDIVMEWSGKLGIAEFVESTIYGSWENFLSLITGWAKPLLPNVLNTTAKIGGGIVNTFVSLFIAIYFLADKERLTRHFKLVVRALTKPAQYDTIMLAGTRALKIFSGFISGKLLDSLIIGILCLIGTLILGIPYNYSLLVAVIVAVTNIIPTFGPFIGAVPCILIILIYSPIKALYYIIFLLALQQFDGNVLGPKILGDSTGLSAFWVLISIVFFGSLWGVAGMLVGVPIGAFIYIFAKEGVIRKLKKKGYGADNETIGTVSAAPAKDEPAAQKK